MQACLPWDSFSLLFIEFLITVLPVRLATVNPNLLLRFSFIPNAFITNRSLTQDLPLWYT